MRFREIVTAVSLLMVPAAGMAQLLTPGAPPPADPADVSSLDAVMKAVYDVISGPAGAPRDWNRMRSLFIPGARLGPVVPASNGRYVTQIGSLEEWIEGAQPFFAGTGFFEREITRRTELFGHMGHTFSTYESRHAANDSLPFQRGINSMQLFNDGTRWWIVSIYWTAERADNPIPRKYLQP